MNCAQHADRPIAAYCCTCGKALCESCKREIRSAIYCEDCLARRVQTAVPPAGNLPGQPAGGPHPAVAGVLAGMLPFGVAPVYNGQYSRGLVYLVVFIGLAWGCGQGASAAVVCGIAMGAFYCWQFIDAVRSAHYLQRGLPAPDPFGVDRLFGGIASPAPPPAAGPAPAPWVNVATPASTPYVPPAPIPAGAACEHRGGGSCIPFYALLLIVLGVLFLLSNLGLFSMHWVHRLWPLILIATGGWLLHARWGDITGGTPGGRHRLMGPAVLLALGSGFMVDKLFDLSIWLPVLLIVIGLVLVWQRTPPPYRPSGPPPGGASPPENSVTQNSER
jgi:hypothetical protein